MREISIHKIGDTTQVRISNNGKSTSINCNSNRDVAITKTGVIIVSDPNERTLNNFKINVVDLSNAGINFAGVATPQDLLDKIAEEKLFKLGGGLGSVGGIDQNNTARFIYILENELINNYSLDNQGVIEYLNAQETPLVKDEFEQVFIKVVKSIPIIALTSFLASSINKDSCSDSSPDPINTTLYHNGSNTFPVDGDFVYEDINSVTPYVTTLHVYMANGEFLQTIITGEKTIISCK